MSVFFVFVFVFTKPGNVFLLTMKSFLHQKLKILPHWDKVYLTLAIETMTSFLADVAVKLLNEEKKMMKADA